MMSLLVVDDEVIIADGIADMVQEVFDGRLVVYRAYSAARAQAIIQNMPIDILLTDIDMPEVSGLELHSWLRSRWPLCKVLFLTGYNEFAYVRQALEQQAFAYLLKSDGDTRITEAIERTLLQIEHEQAQLLADPRLKMARPAYIKECVTSLLYTPDMKPYEIHQLFQGWDLQVSPHAPVWFAIGTLSGNAYNASDAASVLESIMDGRLKHLVTEVNQSTLAVITQNPGEPDAKLFSGLLETAQRILQHGGSAYFTVILADRPVAWESLCGAYQRMMLETGVTCPSPGELIEVSPLMPALPPVPAEIATGWADALKHAQLCSEYLMTGQKKLYYWESQKLWALLEPLATQERTAMIAHALLLGIDACMQGFAGHASAYEAARQRGGDSLRAFHDPTRTRKAIDELAGLVFDAQQEKADDRKRGMIGRVNAFIREHLCEDLSLTRIAAAVNFHPAYLSRIYKESTGMGLSEYIQEQRLSAACAMLTETQLRIVDISSALGFSSPTYFARFFKKHRGVSPQEYRDRSQG